MGSPLAPWHGAPDWPDFKVAKENGFWTAYTNTGRPKTPIFRLWLRIARDAPEEEARENARAALDTAYERAHPNGCPGGH